MSVLAIEQLENNVTVAQKIKLLKSTNLETLRLNMYKQGTLVDGVVTVEVYDGATLLGSMSHSCVDFNSIGPNFHGMVGFYPDNPIAIRKDPRVPYLELTFKVTVTSFTDSSTAFIGLVRNPEPPVGIYNQSLNPNPALPETDVWYLPYGLELYTT